MARSKETYGKKDVRSKQLKKRKEKEKRRQEKKESGKSNSFDDMIAWVDEKGVITSTPPDPGNKQDVEAENIEISVPKAELRINNSIRTGRLKSFDFNKGFGFIVDSQSKESIFVHIADFKGEIKISVRVEFEVEKGIKGKKAVNVKVI